MGAFKGPLFSLFSPPTHPHHATSTPHQVLFSITGCCLPGELLALMGPSGSGKTSLLSILGFRTPKGATVAGDILFNGTPQTKRAKRQLGFVLQDDLLYESLTVAETLHFAAALRLPRTMAPAAKRARVDEVIIALGLDKCRDTIIGGFFRRGISGGERKRVSVGHELLINPSVLLLDEPTSGLDSTTAMRLVTTLRSLAAGGRAVATTIHQPSSRLFQLLDKLLLLSDGHAIYYGSASLAADWFHRLGFTLPYGVNAADFLLDVASGDVTSDADRVDGTGDAARRALVAAYERFADLVTADQDGYSASADLTEDVVGAADWATLRGRRGLSMDVSAAAGLTPTGSAGSGVLTVAAAAPADAVPPALLDASTAPRISAPRVSFAPGVSAGDDGASVRRRLSSANGLTTAATNGSTTKSNKAADTPAARYRKANALQAFLSGLPGSKAPRWGASYGAQVRILFTRAVKTRRFEALSGQDVAQFVIVGTLAGLFWWQIGQDRTLVGAINAKGLLFFEMLFLSFRAMFTALFTFPNEYKMMLKERASGMYRLSAFYFARTLSDVPMEVTIPSLFIIIVYFAAGLRLTAWAFFANWAAVMLTLLVAQSFGLLIGATVMVPKTAQTVTAVIMLTMMLVGGFYVTNIPTWIGWLKYLSFIYYGYNLLLKIEYKGVTLWDCGGASRVSPPPADNSACTPIPPGGLAAKAHLQENTENWPWEALALLAWLLVFRYAVYVALRVKTASKAPK